jgi:hypothetical protein
MLLMLGVLLLFFLMTLVFIGRSRAEHNLYAGAAVFQRTLRTEPSVNAIQPGQLFDFVSPERMSPS